MSLSPRASSARPPSSCSRWNRSIVHAGVVVGGFVNARAWPMWFYPAALALVAIQVAVLHTFGQPFVSTTGRLMLWVNDVWSNETSQQFADWYSFSHIIHGFIFFGILHLIAPRLPVAAR